MSDETREEEKDIVKPEDRIVGEENLSEPEMPSVPNPELQNTSEFFAVMEDPAIIEAEEKMQFLSDFLKEGEGNREQGAQQENEGESSSDEEAEVEGDVGEDGQFVSPESEEPQDESVEFDELEISLDEDLSADKEKKAETELEKQAAEVSAIVDEQIPLEEETSSDGEVDIDEEGESGTLDVETELVKNEGTLVQEENEEKDSPVKTEAELGVSLSGVSGFGMRSENKHEPDLSGLDVTVAIEPVPEISESPTQLIPPVPDVSQQRTQMMKPVGATYRRYDKEVVQTNAETALRKESPTFASRKTERESEPSSNEESLPARGDAGSVSEQSNVTPAQPVAKAKAGGFETALQRLQNGYDEHDVQELGFCVIKRFSEMYAKSSDPEFVEIAETLRDYCDWHDGTFYDLWETIGHNKATEIAGGIQSAFADAWKTIGRKMQEDQQLHSDGRLQTRDENGDITVPMGKGPINAMQRAIRGYDDWQLKHMSVSEPARLAVLLRELSRSAHGWPKDYPETPKLMDVRESWPNDTWCNAFVRSTFGSNEIGSGKTNREMGLGYAAWTQDCLTASNALILMSASLDPDDRVARALKYGTEEHRQLVIEKGRAAWAWVGDNVLGLWD